MLRLKLQSLACLLRPPHRMHAANINMVRGRRRMHKLSSLVGWILFRLKYLLDDIIIIHGSSYATVISSIHVYFYDYNLYLSAE